MRRSSFLPLILAVALLVIGVPLAGWAGWGAVPEPNSKVLATPDGTPVSSTNPLPVGQRVASSSTWSAVDPDQAEAAADFPATATRASLCCQNVGTTPVRVRVGAATGGTVGQIVGGGTAANDGLGGSFCTTLTSAVYLYDVAGLGTADVQCVEETW